MTLLRLILIGLMAGALTTAACGKKGDPIRPGSEKEERETM